MSSPRELMTWDGRTLALVKDFCDGKVAEARMAVLYEKPHSVVACDYVWRTTEAWITLPWSAEPPVTDSEPLSEQHGAAQLK